MENGEKQWFSEEMEIPRETIHKCVLVPIFFNVYAKKMLKETANMAAIKIRATWNMRIIQ